MGDGKHVALLLGGAAAVGIAGLAVAAAVGGAGDGVATLDETTGDADVGQGDGSDGSSIADAVTSVVAAARDAASSIGLSGRVLDRQYADGVHPALQWLLDEWEREGSHVLRIAHSLRDGDGIPNGGLRTEAEVQSAAAQGLSAATNVRESPHPRAAALDVWPDGFNWHRDFDSQPGMLEKMQTFGAWAEGKVGPNGERFTWGGRWPKPDDDHVEITNWQGLPYPPPDYPSATNG